MTSRQKGVIVLASILTLVYIFMNNKNVDNATRNQLLNSAAMEAKRNYMKLMAYSMETGDSYEFGGGYRPENETIDTKLVTNFFTKAEKVLKFSPENLVKFNVLKKKFQMYGYSGGSSVLSVSPDEAGKLAELYNELSMFISSATGD